MVLFILGGAVGAMAAWQIHLLSCCFLLSRGEQMSLSCRCSRLHLAGVGAGFAVIGMGGRALADCRTASFIRRTAQSTLFQLKHRTDSRLIISNSLSPILCQIAEPPHDYRQPPGSPTPPPVPYPLRHLEDVEDDLASGTIRVYGFRTDAQLI
jgi:hypothetical protein